MKAVIVLSYVENIEKINKNCFKGKIIAADGGNDYLNKIGIKPSVWIGDGDSSASVTEAEVSYKLPEEKDFTDLEAAIVYAIKEGFEKIHIIGGFGGRFDHTYGNINTIVKYIEKAEFIIEDGDNRAYFFKPGKYIIKKDGFKYLSFFSITDKVEKLTVNNVKYPLENFDLERFTSLTVSNEILGNQGIVSFEKGILMAVQSEKNTNCF